LKLSLSLVESMAASLKDLDLNDRYREALREMIDAKISGKEVVQLARRGKAGRGHYGRAQASIEQTKAKKKADGKGQRRKRKTRSKPPRQSKRNKKVA